MDFIIFSGQSNMQGQTEGLPKRNPPISGAWEYVYQKNTLRPLQHPVGETVETNGQALLLGASKGGGSLVPAFCKKYVEESGRKVLAVHVAKGATTIAEWQPNTLRYGAMVEKIVAAKKKLQDTDSIENIYFVWLQGESDAIAGTSEEEYYNRFMSLKNALKKDVGASVFGIVKVGYFASEATWFDEGDMDSRVQQDERIMSAQERIVQENSDCIMLTRVCTKISKNVSYINPFESAHYNNKGMKKIGEEAALELYRCTKS